MGARHSNTPHRNPLLGEHGLGLKRNAQFGAGGQNDRAFARGIRQHIATAPDLGHEVHAGGHLRQVLA